jgi:hypothetical protein
VKSEYTGEKGQNCDCVSYITTLDLSTADCDIFMAFASKSYACYCVPLFGAIFVLDNGILVLLERSSACGFLPACTDVRESDAGPVKSARKMAVAFASRLHRAGNLRGKIAMRLINRRK